jgi:hypothetical protein
VRRSVKCYASPKRNLGVDRVNYIEFLSNSTDYFERNRESQRLGQAVSNFLAMVRPDIASELIGTILDPYYEDSVPVEVWEFIHQKW